MSKITVLIKSEPYSDESAYSGLKFALTALKNGHSVEIFLLQGGVFCAISSQNPSHLPNLYEKVETIIENGGRIVCCGTCTKARGVLQAMVHPNVEIGTMDMLLDMVCSSDHVITF